MAWRVEVVFTVWEALMIAFVVSTIAVTAYLLVRFVVRIRSGDEMETAHHSGSNTSQAAGKEQTPEEAVEEWERKRRKRSCFRRPRTT